MVLMRQEKNWQKHMCVAISTGAIDPDQSESYPALVIDLAECDQGFLVACFIFTVQQPLFPGAPSLTLLMLAAVLNDNFLCMSNISSEGNRILGTHHGERLNELQAYLHLA